MQPRLSSQGQGIKSQGHDNQCISFILEILHGMLSMKNIILAITMPARRSTTIFYCLAKLNDLLHLLIRVMFYKSAIFQFQFSNFYTFDTRIRRYFLILY